jgi:hypothetical protein
MKLVLNSLILIVLFTGCSVFNKNVFAKRKYTKGYFIESKHSNKKLEVYKSKKTNRTSELIKTQKEEIYYARVDDLSEKKSIVEENCSPQTQVKIRKSNLKDKFFINKRIEQPSLTNNFSIANYAKKMLVSIDEKSDGGNSIEAVEFILYSILFVFLAIVYTASILLRAPGFPLVLAIPIAIVMALLTVITGVYFF